PPSPTLRDERHRGHWRPPLACTLPTPGGEENCFAPANEMSPPTLSHGWRRHTGVLFQERLAPFRVANTLEESVPRAIGRAKAAGFGRHAYWDDLQRHPTSACETPLGARASGVRSMLLPDASQTP